MGMTTAITGATGKLGRLVINKLKATDGSLVALARSPEKAADLGITVRRADYDDPSTLTAALEGIDTLVLISASEPGKRLAQHQRVIDAAKAAGVSWIIYTSILHADRSPIDLAVEHRATEKAIIAAGISHTFLRNGWYHENHTASLGGVLAGGAVLGAAGDGKIYGAARADYADAIVAVLGGGHEGRTYELAGDTGYSMSDYAAEVSRQTGRTIPYKNLPEEEYAKLLAGFGLPEGLARSIAGWDTQIEKGALVDTSRTLSTLIGHPTTPLATAIEAALPR